MRREITSSTSPLIIGRLNAVRIIVVLCIALGYASTMPLGPGNSEMFAHFGQDPGWLGVQVLFFLSGFLALRSIRRHGSGWLYLRSRFIRNIPLLAIVTLVAVLIIYPSLGVTTESFGALSVKLGTYFLATVSCLDPGRVLPGLLDDANYTCLIQGAIWTLRWGMLAHIAVAIGAWFNLFKSNIFILALAIFTAIAASVLTYIQVKTNMEITWLDKPWLTIRLAHPFLAGMACFAYRDKITGPGISKYIVLAGFGLGAAFWYNFLLWSPVIEKLLVAFWCYAALLLATSTTPKLKFLENWPDLALGVYLINWPASQLILLALPGIGPWGLIAITLPVSLQSAYASYLLLSKRSFNYARALSTPKQAAIT